MKCTDCQEKNKQYAVMKADYDFEIKKLREDLSLEKVSLQMQFQKEAKRLTDKYNKEKSQREEDNKNWISKYDTLRAEHELQIQRLHRDLQTRKQQLEKQVRQEYAQKYQQERAAQAAALSQLKKTHEEQKLILMQSNRKEVAQLQTANEQKVRTLLQQHQNLINQIAADYEAKINSIRKDCAETAALYEKLKTDSQLSQNGLYRQLYQRKQEIQQLRQRSQSLDAALKKAQAELKRREEELEATVRKHEEKVQSLLRGFEQEKENIVQQMSRQMQALLRSKLQDCQKFEEKVKVIEEKRETEVKMYQSSLLQVKQLVQVRLSREEDLEEINTLRSILNQKERELKEAIEEARTCRLQLDNREETFNRIFTATPQIERVRQRSREIRISKGVSLPKETAKYNSVGTSNNLPESKREVRLIIPMSSKQF